MPDIAVRQATLDDTNVISTLFRAHIHTWQRLDAHGRPEDVPYEALTIYERWLHGGAWMSVETGALQLSHLLRGAGLPLVAEVDGQVCAYTEAYHSREPAPFGDNLSMTHPVVHPDYVNSGVEDALVADLIERAKALRCDRFQANLAVYEYRTLYERHGLKPLATIRRYNLPARTGQGFYRAVEHLASSASQIEDWYMPVGRLSSSRQQWETLWPGTWDALPEIHRQKIHRLHLNAAGQEALVCCQQQLFAPRSVDVYCWSPKPLTGQLLTSIRDWAHREGYRTLVLSVMDSATKILGQEAEADGYTQETYALDVR